MEVLGAVPCPEAGIKDLCQVVLNKQESPLQG